MPQVFDFKCYVDASFAADLDMRRSTTSMESEYMAATSASQEQAIWLNRLLEEMGFRSKNRSYYTKITRQLAYYFQIILVIIGGQSILTPGNTFYVTQ